MAFNDIFQKAKYLQELKSKKGERIKDLAVKMGVKPSYICHILRLNKIPEIVVDGYYSQLISISHLFVISRLNDVKQIVAVYEKILADNLTVIQTEEIVRDIIHKIKSTGNYLNKEQVTHYIATLIQKYKNTGVKLIQTRIKSKIIIEIKGSLQETSMTAKQILDKLMK